MAISAAMLPEFDQEMATTRKVLERVSDSIFSYKPHAKSFTSVQLASHIVDMLGWLTGTMMSDSFDMNPPGGTPWTPWIAASNAELMAKYDEAAKAAREALAVADDAAMMKTWSLLNAGNTVFAMPRVACVRGMILNHIIHHRGQLSVYLRMNDIPVPSLYGPSADEGRM